MHLILPTILFGLIFVVTLDQYATPERPYNKENIDTFERTEGSYILDLKTLTIYEVYPSMITDAIRLTRWNEDHTIIFYYSFFYYFTALSLVCFFQMEPDSISSELLATVGKSLSSALMICYVGIGITTHQMNLHIYAFTFGVGSATFVILLCNVTAFLLEKFDIDDTPKRSYPEIQPDSLDSSDG